MIDISQMQNQFEQLMPAAPSKKSSRKSILALSVFALGLNAAAAAYTMSPSDFALPDVHRLVAELLPHEKPPVPMQDLVAAALSDIQSTQQDIVVALQDNGLSLHRNAALLQEGLQRNAALLHDNGTSLQQNTALLQQNATKLDILRQEDGAKLDILRSSLTDEHSDVKVISSQLSTLIAKVELGASHDVGDNLVHSEETRSHPAIWGGAQTVCSFDKTRRTEIGWSRSAHYGACISIGSTQPSRLKRYGADEIAAQRKGG